MVTQYRSPLARAHTLAARRRTQGLTTTMTAPQLQQLALDLAEQHRLDVAFRAFHERNPQVFEVLRDMALEAKARKERLGLKYLYEIARWTRRLPTEGDAYKLNNNHASRYSRLLMEREPQLRGFFATRALADERKAG